MFKTLSFNFAFVFSFVFDFFGFIASADRSD